MTFPYFDFPWFFEAKTLGESSWLYYWFMWQVLSLYNINSKQCANFCKDKEKMLVRKRKVDVKKKIVYFLPTNSLRHNVCIFYWKSIWNIKYRVNFVKKTFIWLKIILMQFPCFSSTIRPNETLFNFILKIILNAISSMGRCSILCKNPIITIYKFSISRKSSWSKWR